MNPKNKAKNSVQVRVTVTILATIFALLIGRNLQESVLWFLVIISIFNFLWGGNYAEKKSEPKEGEEG